MNGSKKDRTISVESSANEALMNCSESFSRMGCRSQGMSAQNDGNFEMEFLTESSLQEMIDLQTLILEHLPDAEIFFPHDLRYFQRIFQHDRSVIGVRAEESLVAYSIIRIPGCDQDNLGRDIGLAGDELAAVAHLQATVVHPAFRGNGLQKKMASSHLAVIEDLGYEHVFCTVSPKNPASLGNIIRSGLMIKGLRPKYGDWWRYIMYRNLSWPKNMNKELEKDEKTIMGSDLSGQQILLNEGFVGFKMAIQPDGFVLSYGRSSSLQ